MPTDTLSLQALRETPCSADAADALALALRALAMAVAATLPDAQRATLADNLGTLTRRAEDDGHALLETLLMDLHSATRF